MDIDNVIWMADRYIFLRNYRNELGGGGGGRGGGRGREMEMMTNPSEAD